MKTTHFLKHLLIGLVIIAALGLVVMLLWNWLIPSIFGWSAVNYWKALGLLALSRILLGGRGWHGRHRQHFNDYRNPIREKWVNMSPEDRKEFIKKLKSQREQTRRDWGSRFHSHDFQDLIENAEPNPFSDKANE